MGAYSFHVTKNVVCGEGGAFVTDDDELARRAEIVWEKGTNRSAFLRGEADKYSWCDVGGSFVPSDLLLALLEVQVKKLDTIIAARRKRWERYEEALKPLAAAEKIRLHHVEVRSEFNYHLFAFRTIAVPQEKLIVELRRRGIEATFHFVPLHTSPYGRKHFPNQPPLPHTEAVAASLVRLPLYPDLTLADQDRVIEAVSEVCRGT
jgi:dTDP-4-amino-4,6-dideoxygalactose transaminase